jgi:hypothetical protein
VRPPSTTSWKSCAPRRAKTGDLSKVIAFNRQKRAAEK